MKGIKENIKPLAIIIFFYVLLFSLGITCPIKFLTGISCPGCGLTRAWIAALQLHFADAYSFHPLFWLVPVLLILIFKYERYKCAKPMLAGCAFLFISIYAFRMVSGDGNIVVFEPTNGLLCKTIQILLGG